MVFVLTIKDTCYKFGTVQRQIKQLIIVKCLIFEVNSIKIVYTYIHLS